MKIEFGKSFGKKLKMRIEKYDMQVGILEDKPHYEAVETPRFGPPTNQKTYAGGPARKQTRVRSELSTSEIFIANQKRLNINLLLRPFQETSSEIMRFTTAFLKTACAQTNPKRVENLLQAIVRNPILNQEYGRNDSSTADNKGFDRNLIDTSQMFKAIKARVKRV